MQIGAKVALLGLCFGAASSLCAAQSLGDLARQERARRAQETRHVPVITNEDLKRERILPPAAPAAVKPAPVPDAPSSAALPVSTHPGPNVPLWHVADQPGFSLGSYARALREEKQQREAEQNAKAAPRPEIDRGASALVRSVARPALADLPPAVRRPAAAEHQRRVAERKAKVVMPRLERKAGIVVRHSPRKRIVRVQESDPTRVLVQPGDSLWRIASDLFGDGRLWTALWHANPGIRNPNLIYAGQTLRVPSPVQVTALRLKLHAAASHAGSVRIRSAVRGTAATQAPAAVPAARLEVSPAPLPDPRR